MPRGCVPGECLLTVDHRAIGELAEQIRCHDEESRRDKARRGRLDPTFGVVTGSRDEVGHILETHSKAMRAKPLIDQGGRVHPRNANDA